MLLNSGFAVVCVLWASVAVDCRSIGEPVGVNSPDQANYQDYGEQQEYVERQVRDVEDRPEKYVQKENARDSQERSNEGVKAAPEAAYQSRDNGDDEDQEAAAPPERVAVDRRELEERDEKKEDAGDAEVAGHRNDERLRQSSNDIPQGGDAGYQQPRENQAEVNAQERARMTEAARSQVAEGYDAMNDPPAAAAKDDSYVAGDYTNYDYAPEQGEPQQRAEGQQNLKQNVAPVNEAAAPPSQYEQEN